MRVNAQNTGTAGATASLGLAENTFDSRAMIKIENQGADFLAFRWGDDAGAAWSLLPSGQVEFQDNPPSDALYVKRGGAADVAYLIQETVR